MASVISHHRIPGLTPTWSSRSWLVADATILSAEPSNYRDRQMSPSFDTKYCDQDYLCPTGCINSSRAVLQFLAHYCYFTGRITGGRECRKGVHMKIPGSTSYHACARWVLPKDLDGTILWKRANRPVGRYTSPCSVLHAGNSVRKPLDDLPGFCMAFLSPLSERSRELTSSPIKHKIRLAALSLFDAQGLRTTQRAMILCPRRTLSFDKTNISFLYERLLLSASSY